MPIYMNISRTDDGLRDVYSFHVEITGAELARVAHDLPWRCMDDDVSVADKLLLLAVIAKKLAEDEILTNV